MATYKHTQKGWIRESGSLMGYPWVEVDSETLQPEGFELGAATADAILEQVGNDPVLAQLALTTERERDKPRTVLTAKLERIVENAES